MYMPTQSGSSEERVFEEIWAKGKLQSHKEITPTLTPGGRGSKELMKSGGGKKVIQRPRATSDTTEQVLQMIQKQSDVIQWTVDDVIEWLRVACVTLV